jgi:hypothetical protein
MANERAAFVIEEKLKREDFKSLCIYIVDTYR